ncbi:MAG TPA: LPS export ABC transporter periplasmic protein LptC [Cytophagaceae bacterium]|nr:LPS export ABC transporter periplasmic protein LptC [Cytophagaceae bacterium]
MFSSSVYKALLFLIVCITFSGCLKPSKTMEEMKPYSGPVMEIENSETIYSDSAETKVILRAAKQIELQNGNREFPNGVLVEFYENGVIKSTLTSNFARFYKNLNKYMVSGDVVIRDMEEGKRMNTEELFWLPMEERIYIVKDKQVIITTKDGVLHGKGLEAKQDFSKYKILNPTSPGINLK